MVTHGLWPKRALLWLLFFWLVPLAWLITKFVLLAYVQTIKAFSPRE
jgi:hypothetical protein